MNSYYPASFFAQYSSDGPHLSHNVNYNSANYGLLASRFADQITAYHNSNFNVDHHRMSNGYSQQNHDSQFHTRDGGGGGGTDRLQNSSYPHHHQQAAPPAHQHSADDNLPRSYSSCSTDNWSPPPNGVHSSSPDSVHHSTSPFSPQMEGSSNSCPMMMSKHLKGEQTTGSEQPTPFYPWMGIVGELSYFKSKLS